ncbi:MAG: TolC family outer membrane protein [Gammaproteobacteria bacterium]|nr:TolC family outer membrane protein [Gammaproteobacteria bacterium]
MRKDFYRSLLLCGVMMLPLSCFAADLSEVFEDAYSNDPTFKAAQAEFQAIRQNIPLNISNFLPHIALSSSATRSRQDSDFGNAAAATAAGFSQQPFYDNNTNFTLSATQSIFNYGNWASLSTARAQVKQAAANLSAAAQELMIRTSTAYFSVLTASQDLHFTQAEKNAIKHELDQNKDRYQVGLIPITAVYEAQARFDAVVAREIASKYQYSNRIEELRQITGKYYRILCGIEENIPLISPDPSNIEQWVTTAEKQNYTFLAARYGSEAAKENIKFQFAGHFPVVNASSNFTETFDNHYNGDGSLRTKVANVSVSGTLPVSSGGAVLASTDQARCQYQQALSLEEATHRSVVAQTRNAYLGVISEISQVRADKQAIISSQSAYDATLAAYDVGTRTMVDVLNAQSNLFNIQRLTVTEQYNYLLQTLLLKKTAGTLSPQDIITLNRLMRKRTEIITEKDIIHTEIPRHNIPTQLDIHASQYEAEKIIPFSAATTKHHSKKTTKKKKKSHS